MRRGIVESALAGQLGELTHCQQLSFIRSLGHLCFPLFMRCPARARMSCHPWQACPRMYSAGLGVANFFSGDLAHRRSILIEGGTPVCVCVTFLLVELALVAP